MNRCFITGCTSKLGQMLLKYFLSKNYTVQGHYNNNIEKIKKIIINYQKNFSSISCNFNNTQESIDHLFNFFQNNGFPNIIINNASSFFNDNITDLKLDILDTNLNVNFKTPLYLISKISPYLPDNTLIINILDYFNNNIPDKNFLSYGISKSIMYNLTPNLAKSLSPKIRVNAIAIGPTIADPKEDPNAFYIRSIDNPLNIKATEIDIINAIEFIINTKSITGEIIHIDGGRHLNLREDYFLK